jgi:hypothetical protein
MTLRPPTERPLPNRQQILDRVLDAEREVVAAPRRGKLVPIVAAAAVAAALAAALLVPPMLRSDGRAPTPAAPSATEISIDRGPLSKADTATFLKHCWFWNGTSERVVHAVKVKSGWHGGEEWAVAMIGRSVGGNGVKPGGNRVTGCSGLPHGPTDSLVSDQGFRIENFITATTPMRYDDRFRPADGTYLLDEDRGGKLGTSLWIRVPSQVERVRQRLVVDGKPGVWFSSRTADGLSYVQTWLETRPQPTAKVELQVQFLNGADQVVTIPGSNGLTSTVPIAGVVSYQR